MLVMLSQSMARLPSALTSTCQVVGVSVTAATAAAHLPAMRSSSVRAVSCSSMFVVSAMRRTCGIQVSAIRPAKVVVMPVSVIAWR
ncbi:hypothetical protein, partial [Micromonospora gifhornensis]